MACNGNNSSNSSNYTGSGGGGAGGSILLQGNTITLGSPLVSSAAGNAGVPGADAGRGGDGSVGRIHADYGTSCTGTTSPTLDKTQNDIYIPNAPPTAFSLTAPSNNTSTNNPKPTFSWQTSTDPESLTITYTMKLSTTPGFTDPVYRTVSSLSSTSYTAVTEIADGSYYWNVIASDGVMQTESAPIWQLTVDTQKPVAPTITTFYPDIATGKITKIYGTGENGTTLTFYDQNNNPITGTTAWDGSNFTFTPTTPLAPGSTVYVKSEDGAQNSSQSATNVINFECVKNVLKDDAVMHGDPPGNSMRIEKDTSYEFNIAVNDGVTPDPQKPVTVKAYVQYNAAYGSAAKPKITLSGLGITGSEEGQYAEATGAAQDAWEQLTVTGTPNAKGVLTLKVETFSTVDGAKAWIDDISVAQ